VDASSERAKIGSDSVVELRRITGPSASSWNTFDPAIESDVSGIAVLPILLDQRGRIAISAFIEFAINCNSDRVPRVLAPPTHPPLI
jgi:hypothetical protein